jgi:predicted pyridoxine 5'-phosphate oxidase superfamily flavin-nucleotide-binding protein
MDTAIKDRIARAKELLATAQNAAMATVNEDGSPHNTPFFFIHDDALEYVYWGSHPGSLHCKNALRTGQIFVVLYDMNKGGGLYIKANNAAVLTGVDLEKGLAIHNAFRVRNGKEPLGLDYYTTASEQRMYRAKTTSFYVNSATRNDTGRLLQDVRYEIRLSDLTS